MTDRQDEEQQKLLEDLFGMSSPQRDIINDILDEPNKMQNELKRQQPQPNDQIQSSQDKNKQMPTQKNTTLEQLDLWLDKGEQEGEDPYFSANKPFIVSSKTPSHSASQHVPKQNQHYQQYVHMVSQNKAYGKLDIELDCFPPKNISSNKRDINKILDSCDVEATKKKKQEHSESDDSFKQLIQDKLGSSLQDTEDSLSRQFRKTQEWEDIFQKGWTSSKPTKKMNPQWQDQVRGQSQIYQDFDMLMSTQQQISVVAFNDTQYLLERELKSGVFDKLYIARRIDANRGYLQSQPELIAVRVVLKTPQCQRKEQYYEGRVLLNLKLSYGIPKGYYLGETRRQVIFAMELLGPNLRDIGELFGKTKTIWTSASIANLAVEAIRILWELHAQGFIHGDVKPENFLLGQQSSPKQKSLYLIGYGQAKLWCDHSVNVHIPFEQKPIETKGTNVYTSVHVQLGKRNARRDDLESLIYVMAELLLGSLPWSRCEGLETNYYMSKEKMRQKPSMLFHKFPSNFQVVAEKIFRLGFEESPNYLSYIEELLPLCKDETWLVPHAQLSYPLAYQDPQNVDLSILSSPIHSNQQTKSYFDWLSAEWTYQIKFRLGDQTKQWMCVYRHFEQQKSPKQVFSSNPIYDNDLEVKINEWFLRGYYVQSATGFEQYWFLVFEQDQSIKHQIYHLAQSTQVFPKDWIQARWKEGYIITAIARTENNKQLIVMVKSRSAQAQTFIVHKVFPYHLVEQKWLKGYRVTALAASDNTWVLILSKGTGMDKQQALFDFQYPREGISRMWRQGFYVTSIAASNCEVVAIMSTFVGSQYENPIQEIVHRNNEEFDEVLTHISKPEHYVDDITYGRFDS